MSNLKAVPVPLTRSPTGRALHIRSLPERHPAREQRGAGTDPSARGERDRFRRATEALDHDGDIASLQEARSRFTSAMESVEAAIKRLADIADEERARASQAIVAEREATSAGTSPSRAARARSGRSAVGRMPMRRDDGHDE